jgi:hypothetical protein
MGSAVAFHALSFSFTARGAACTKYGACWEKIPRRVSAGAIFFSLAH